MLDKSPVVLGTLLNNLHEIAEVLLPEDTSGEIRDSGLETKVSSFKNTFWK
jgi:hypothetical protein